MNGKEYLSVYGTLRNGYDLKLRDRVAKDLEYLGKAKVEASYMIQENIQELLKKKKIVR